MQNRHLQNMTLVHGPQTEYTGRIIKVTKLVGMKEAVGRYFVQHAPN